MDSGVWVDCMTVPESREVLNLHWRQRSTDGRAVNRYGSPGLPQSGQTKPVGQRSFSRESAQATSFANTFWNSGRLVGKPRGSINGHISRHYRLWYKSALARNRIGMLKPHMHT